MKETFKILIVEDEPELRDFLVNFCIVNAYQVDFASNGVEALNLISNNGSYGLIIVDFLMPNMHGVEFVRQARAQYANLPIIAMSAWDDVESSFIAAGANLFLRKPFDPYFLEKLVESIAKASPIKECFYDKRQIGDGEIRIAKENHKL